MIKGNIWYDNMCTLQMVRKRVTFTIEPKLISRLQHLAKINRRSMSSMIEILIEQAYENKGEVAHSVVQDTIDKIERKPKKPLDPEF